VNTNDYTYHQRRDGAVGIGAISDDTTVRRLRNLLEEPKPKPAPEPTAPLWRRVASILGLVLQLAIATQGLEWNGPKLTPQEAVNVLQSSHSDRDRTGIVAPTVDGPVVVVAPCWSCDVQRSIALALARRQGAGVGFYARGFYGSTRQSTYWTGPLQGHVSGRANGRRR
jgi:hypothetical protein